MQFTATILATGETTTGRPVPEEVVAAGDEVDVTIALDSEPREIEALEAYPEATAAFMKLSNRRGPQLRLSASKTKSDETRVTARERMRTCRAALGITVVTLA